MILAGLGDLGVILGGSWGVVEGSWRRVAILLVGSEGWAACFFGCISSVSSRPVSPVLTTIEFSSQLVALK